MEHSYVAPLLEGEIEHLEDGTIKTRGFLFWDKQILRLYYNWTKAGNCLNPNVRITLEDPSERPN